MEIEHKFRVDDEGVFPALRELRSLGRYTLSPESQPERQHNIYFDTADRRIRGQRHGLRIREIDDGRRIVTLKGAASVQAGRFTRNEWEVAIGPDDAPTSWPESEARAHTLALIGDAPLLRLLTIDTTRFHIIAREGERAVAELSLDAGNISAGERSEAFRELEIELLPDGTTDDLDALCKALQDRFVLEPDERTKLGRGLALLDEEDKRQETREER